MSETENTPVIMPGSPPTSSDIEAAPASPTSDSAFSWTTAEFAGHQKSAGWYGSLLLGAVILATLVYFLFKDIISTAVVLIGAALLGFYAGRQPDPVRYQLDEAGIMIGNKYRNFDEFRSFSMVQESHNQSIVLAPLRRFAPPTSIYYNQQDEDTIVSVLANSLPMEEHRHDAIDSFMNRIHF